MLRRIPVPPGSRLFASKHHGVRLGHSAFAAIDPTLTRTRWWSVPLSYADLVAWYGKHSPANLGSTRFADGTLSSYGDMSWPVDHATAAYSAPLAVVSYVHRAPHRTLIRTDAIINAHYDRTPATFVPASVDRIDVVRTSMSSPQYERSTGTSTDPDVIARARAAFNALQGSDIGEPSPCGSPGGDEYAYAVTFHWPGHVLEVDPGAELCRVGRGLTLDGTKLAPRLQNTPAFDAALKAAL